MKTLEGNSAAGALLSFQAFCSKASNTADDLLPPEIILKGFLGKQVALIKRRVKNADVPIHSATFTSDSTI